MPRDLFIDGSFRVSPAPWLDGPVHINNGTDVEKRDKELTHLMRSDLHRLQSQVRPEPRYLKPKTKQLIRNGRKVCVKQLYIYICIYIIYIQPYLQC